MRPRMMAVGFVGVVGGAAVLVLGACSDDGDGLSAFCRDVQRVEEDFELRSTEPEVVAEQAGELAELDPPGEIADEWQVFVEGMPEFLVMEEPEGESQDLEAAQEFSERSQQYQQAVRLVSAYLRDECGLEG